MKKETYANKLFELLGLQEKAQELAPELVDPKGHKSKYNRVQEIPEEKIQDFRAAQGLIYFLRAPELFSSRICPHCGEHFLVSRMYVAFCSYTCIKKDLNERGLEWRKGRDIEVIVREVYDGNEPLWISPDMVKRLLAVLNSPQESLLSRASTPPEDEQLSLGTPALEEAPSSSVALTTT